jgi:hypothetical protein
MLGGQFSVSVEFSLHFVTGTWEHAAASDAAKHDAVATSSPLSWMQYDVWENCASSCQSGFALRLHKIHFWLQIFFWVVQFSYTCYWAAPLYLWPWRLADVFG